MTRIDRYILSQLLWLFGFFALVLVAVFWINRAVVLFDRLIGDGQSALVFLEFSALALPRLITTVLPIATFAAAVYVSNRLSNESEMTVMLATGTSPWRMMRPVLIFGLVSAIMMAILAHVLMPAAQARLTLREAEISQNVTARLLTEGTFLNPAPGVTFYTRDVGEDGILRDVFLSDSRSDDAQMTYTAAAAYLVREGNQTNLIMIDGQAQRLVHQSNRLSTANFEDFTFDISSLVRSDPSVGESIHHADTGLLIRDLDRYAELAGRGVVVEEIHSRMSRPLFCIVTALIGFATILIGGYSRFGVWREAGLAFAFLILLDGMRGAMSGPVIADPTLWPALYAPSLAGLALATGLLWIAANPRPIRIRGAA